MTQLMETLWENPDSAPLKPFLEGKYYTLNKWPNFGFSNYSPEFVQISAYLSRGYLTKKEILQVIEIDEQLLNYFLNTAHLQGILEAETYPNGSKSDRPSQINRFTNKLKQFFRLH